jgi:hypothetical protein
MNISCMYVYVYKLRYKIVGNARTYTRQEYQLFICEPSRIPPYHPFFRLEKRYSFEFYSP